MVGVQTISDAGGRPHFGARLLFNAKRKDELVWTLKKPRQIPSVLPSGCKRHIPDYTLSKNLGEHAAKEDISDAIAQWYTLAENKFTDMMGLTEDEALAFTGESGRG